MFSRLLSSSRYLVGIAVVGCLLAATLLFVYGGWRIFQTVIETVQSGSVSSKGAKALIVSSIELADLFLLGVVLYIIALGLCELFIVDTLLLPAWLEIRNLDDLKEKLARVVILVLGILFLGQVATWDGERDLLGFGGGIALVIASLTYFLGQKAKKE